MGAQAIAVAIAGWVALALVAPASRATQPAGPDALAFLRPWVTVSADEQQRLDRGEVVALTIGGDDRQIAILVLARLQAGPERLVEWARAIEQFKRGPFVQAIGRFSEPPVLADLDRLTLDDDDADDAIACRPGDCKLKLTADEMTAFKRFRGQAAAPRREGARAAFRRVVLDRLLAYRAGGFDRLAPIADRHRRRTADALAALLAASPYLERVPGLPDWLRRPQPAGVDEQFYYWSKESYGSGKPVIGVTHVAIVRPPPAADRPAALVVGNQLLATHYSAASLGLTMVLTAEGGPSYLAYLNRSELDVLARLLSGFARSTMERRLARQAPLMVQELRRRLESGPPDAVR